MPEKKKRQPITDPALLAELNGTPTDRVPITDPALLAELNDGQEENPKTPVTQAANAPTDALNPVSEFLNRPLPPISKENKIDKSVLVLANHILDSAQGEEVEQDALNKVFGEDIAGNPIARAKHPYYYNLNSIPFHQPGSIIHDITDPHGNPKMTGDYAIHAISSLEEKKRRDLSNLESQFPSINAARSLDADQKAYRSPEAQEAYDKSYAEIANKYDAQISEMKDAAAHLTALQLAYKEHATKKYTPQEAKEKIHALTEEYKERVQKAKGKGEGSESDIATLNLNYNQEKAKIKQNEKYDAVQIGMQQAQLLGDRHAEEDIVKHQNGLQVPEDRRVAYQYAGLKAMQEAAASAAESGQKEISETLNTHSDNINDRLENDNPKYFRKLWGEQLGDYIYRHVDNPLYGTVFSRLKFTPDELREVGKKYGKDAGLTHAQVEKLTPEDVPTASSAVAQAMQSAYNAFTFSNEEDKYGHLFTGKMPTAQHSIDNPKGVLGEIAGGAGTILGFLGQSALTGGVLGEAKLFGDVVKNAGRYETAANMIPLAASNYNNAYESSGQVIGDKPEDAPARHLYALVDATIGTAIMSLDPVTKLGKAALGVASPVEKDFMSMLKNKGIENITKDEVRGQVEKMMLDKLKIAAETGKHTLSQASIMGSVKAANNITNMIFDPEHRYGVMDGVGEAALTGGIAMALPSLFAGINAVKYQNKGTENLLWEVGNNSRKYREEVTKAYKQGEMSKDEAITAIRGIDKAAGIINAEVPNQSIVSGKELNQEQKQSYAFNLLRSHDLNDKMESLNRASNPDKSQLKLVEGELSKLANERTEILNKAGESTSERPVLKTTTEPTGKPEKKLEVPEEKDISLTSHIEEHPLESEQPKTTNNEQGSDINEGRQDGPGKSESEGRGSEAEIRSAADDQGRIEQEENRILSPEDEVQQQPVKQEEETQPALRVKGKRRKFVEEPVEETPTPQEKPIPSENDERSVATDLKSEQVVDNQKETQPTLYSEEDKNDEIKSITIDEDATDPKKLYKSKSGFTGSTIGAVEQRIIEHYDSLKNKGDASTQAKEQEQEGIQPGGEPEHARVEQAGNEVASAETENSNSGEPSREQTEEIITPISGAEEVIPVAESLLETFTPSRSNETRKDGKKIYRKTVDDVEYEVVEKEDGTSYVTELDKSSKTGVDEASQSFESNVEEFSSLGDAVKYVNEQTASEPKQSTIQSEADKRATDIKTRRDEIDLDIKKQRASQHIESQKRSAAERSKDAESYNKHNDNFHKKEARIEKLNEERAELDREERSLSREKEKRGYKETADKIREFGKKVAKGGEGMIGSFPIINPKNVGRFIEIVGDVYERLGNIHVAISKALSVLRGEGLEENVSDEDILKIRPAFEWMERPATSEPTLSKAGRETAEDYLSDIEDKAITYEQAIAEVMSQDDISDASKAKILNYLDWQVKSRDSCNSQELRNEKHDTDYLDSYALTKSEKVSKYLSGETLEDVFGKEVQFDIESKETLLQENLVADVANMVGLAKHHTGSEDVLVYGSDMLGYITKMPDGGDGKSVKKILAASGLNNELQAEHVRLQNELKNTTDPNRISDIKTRMKQLDKLIAKAELVYRDVASGASNVLNAARANRIIRNTYFGDLFAERILTDAQKVSKKETEAVLEKTVVPDKVAEQGVVRSEKSAKEEVKAAEADLQEAPADDIATDLHPTSKKEKAENKKSKSVIERIKDKVSRKPKSEDGRKEIVKKDAARKKAEDYLKGSSIEELLQKAKEQTKKPC